jgi:Flp pilus assembly protein TadG
MRIRKQFFLRCTAGQALVETALILPVMMMIILNVINFGYFFLVALNLATAPRSGVAYSILGFSSSGALTLPAASPATTATSVAYLTYQDMTGALFSPSGASVQVCSKAVTVSGSGTNGTSPNIRSNCMTCSSQSSCAAGAAVTTGSKVPAPDPENSLFVLHRVDVTYTFNVLIPGTPFNIALLPVSICTAAGSCTFHRQVSMRAMD